MRKKLRPPTFKEIVGDFLGLDPDSFVIVHSVTKTVYTGSISLSAYGLVHGQKLQMIAKKPNRPSVVGPMTDEKFHKYKYSTAAHIDVPLSASTLVKEESDSYAYKVKQWAR